MKSVPPVHKFKSRKEWERYVWRKIVEGLAGADDSAGIEKSLDMLLTAHEKNQMIKRAAAVSLLREGKSYREIGEMLWLSSSTISAIRKSLEAQEGYISRHSRWKEKGRGQKPITKKDLKRLEFKFLIKAIFTVPPPPTR